MQHIEEKLINNKVNFIDNYIHATNAADGSKYDANANVSCKNLATLENELNKDINIAVNRRLLANKITQLFSKELSDNYLADIESHLLYCHDESSLKPYCVSLTLYPLLLDGLTMLGGESKAPRHLESFCGAFINLVFAVSAQFAGAVATVEFLCYFDYFARKDYGNNYLEEHKQTVIDHLQHVVYSLNQPAAARGYQSVFWNISFFPENLGRQCLKTLFFQRQSMKTYTTVMNLIGKVLISYNVFL